MKVDFPVQGDIAIQGHTHISGLPASIFRAPPHVLLLTSCEFGHTQTTCTQKILTTTSILFVWPNDQIHFSVTISSHFTTFLYCSLICQSSYNYVYYSKLEGPVENPQLVIFVNSLSLPFPSLPPSVGAFYPFSLGPAMSLVQASSFVFFTPTAKARVTCELVSLPPSLL